MKIQKVLKFIGDPRGLRICKKTVSGWSSILESGLEDVHTVVSTLTPGTKPAVALLKLAFPKATRQTATVVEELDNLHTKLYPILPKEGVTYIAEISTINVGEVDCIIETVRPAIKFSLEEIPENFDKVGECIEVVYRKGEFKRKQKQKKGLSLK